MEPRSLSVLVALAERPREVIAKKDLIERVWGDAFVSDEVLTHAIWDLRRAFGDNASRPEFIQTIPKRGYRLIAPVRRAEPDELAGAAEAGPREVLAAVPGDGDQRAGGGGRKLLLAGLGLAALVAAVWWSSRAEVRAEARELRRIAAENAANPLLDDPDVAVFVGAGRNSPRAVRAFLVGVRYAYRNEQGSERAMARAIEYDPDFVAPWVWRTPPLAQRGDADEIERHRAGLERLYAWATPFETAMIDWAVAVLDGRPARQARALRVALADVPGHRIAINNLAVAHLAMGNPDACWEVLQPLLRERWRFPGLYTLASLCAVGREAVFDAQATLEVALENEPVDPEVYELLWVLAIYREDESAEAKWSKAFARRKREMLPETYRSVVGDLVELLAGRAVADGREETARRLRESRL